MAIGWAMVSAESRVVPIWRKICEPTSRIQPAHVHDLERERDCRGDSRGVQRSGVPGGKRDPGDRDHEAGVQQEQGRPHVGEHPHELAELDRMQLHRLGHVGVLMPIGREGLERVDVGVAVDDAPRHHGLGLRRSSECLAISGITIVNRMP